MTSDGNVGRICTVVLHDDRVSTKDILCGNRVLHVGELAYLSAPGATRLCIAPTGLAANSDEVSIHISLAERFGYENRTRGSVELIEDVESATAMHIELLFRDHYLSRADMWQMMRNVDETVMYRGQVVNYLGSPTAEVRKLYIAGRDVDSAYVAHPQTKPIFRSGSARFTLLIEISTEMLETWIEGSLMYEQLIDGFLPALFRRWEAGKLRHHLSVVLFGHLLLEQDHVLPPGNPPSRTQHGDHFFHVVASEMSSLQWPALLRKLKHIFNRDFFPRPLSLAAQSNMLEAIHLTAMDFADDQNDTRVSSTGTSIIAITAGTGLFDADRTLLKETTDRLIGNSIGVDLVSLSPKPFHPVPLFKYSRNGTVEYALPHWVDISFWKPPHAQSRSVWSLPDAEGPVDAIALRPLHSVGFGQLDEAAMDFYDTQVVRDETNLVRTVVRPRGSIARSDLVGSVETVKALDLDLGAVKTPLKKMPPFLPSPSASPRLDGASQRSTFKTKATGGTPHPLMQTGRKISLGPKGLALGRAVASTTVSAAHASQERDVASATGFHSGEGSSGLAMAIRASLARKPSQQSLLSHAVSEPDQPSNTTKPINIQTDHEADHPAPPDLANVIEKEIADTMLAGALPNDSTPSATLKVGPDFRKLQERELRNDSLDMLSPWVMLLNPCNPRRDNMRIASQYRKWQHVFPRAISSGAFKWSSMCAPAALPLTAEYRPSASELETHYTKRVRRHVLLHSAGLKHEPARNLIERLIDVRLLRGFQIVAIPNSGSDQTFQSKDRPILLALGKRYHELQRLSDFEVQIVQYEPKTAMEGEDERKHYLTSYAPTMQMTTGALLQSEVSYHTEPPIVDWTPLDEYILGLTPSPDNRTKFSRIRLGLTPVDTHRMEPNARTGLRELSDDERRIEGIQRLTQAWQRQRYFSAEDQQHHVSLTKARITSITTPATDEGGRDPNPLAIDYQTRDLSAAVDAFGPAAANQLGDAEPVQPLFAESEKHHSSTFDVTKLVKQMQEPAPFGVEMRDRRWLTMTHLKCFRGDEMTTWLLSAFKDLELRDDAVAVGNELMRRGIFTHVRQKHAFRDGHYFYQITGAFRTTDYPDTASLFSKAPWRSIPATPIAESITSPMMRPVSTDSSSSERGTPTLGPADQRRVLLSQVLQYNVDPARRSDHLQIIDLHYDRIHNPENCYHIQLEWLSASAKLIREAIGRWSSLVESYGLRLVQLPLEEAAKFREHHPFDQPETVTLAAPPPDKILMTPIMEPHSWSPRHNDDRFHYHKALLRRKLDFVLDYEAANAFPSKLNVMYSWGPPTYAYTQFVHKSGLVLVQLLGNDTGDFLLLPNRLAMNRLSGTNKQGESETAESIIKEFKALCSDAATLQQFYKEVDRPRPPVMSPFSQAASSSDLDVPFLALTHRGQTQRHVDTYRPE